jgi:two-component system response regulator AlgR
MTLTLVIADDEALARERLRVLVAELPDFSVVGEAEDGPTALRLIDELRPDLVLLGLAMPGMTGLEVARRMRHRPLQGRHRAGP